MHTVVPFVPLQTYKKINLTSFAIDLIDGVVEFTIASVDWISSSVQACSILLVIKAFK